MVVASGNYHAWYALHAVIFVCLALGRAAGRPSSDRLVGLERSSTGSGDGLAGTENEAANTLHYNTRLRFPVLSMVTGRRGWSGDGGAFQAQLGELAGPCWVSGIGGGDGLQPGSAGGDALGKAPDLSGEGCSLPVEAGVSLGVWNHITCRKHSCFGRRYTITLQYNVAVG